MDLRTLKELNCNGKRVLVRVDFNVPLSATGEVAEDTRIREALPTIQYLQKNGAKVILLSHLGRPDGKVVEKMRLKPVAKVLEKLLGEKIIYCTETIGTDTEKIMTEMQPGEIVLLENTRFYEGEEKNEKKFTATLAKMGDVYVNDAFGTAHRAHATTAGLADFLPAYAGFLMEKEIAALSPLIENPQKPLCMIIGGAKIDTKIGVFENFLEKTKYFLVGGALANTFLAAQGHSVGASLYEKEKIVVAKKILQKAAEKGCTFVLPTDVVTAQEVKNDAKTTTTDIDEIQMNDKILDIGPKTAEKFAKILMQSKTIVWNGPLGLTEFAPFQNGSRTVAEALIKSNATTIIGGGDTIEMLHVLGLPQKKYSHISTGGGAMIEFLEGKTLPGIKVLLK